MRSYDINLQNPIKSSIGDRSRTFSEYKNNHIEIDVYTWDDFRYYLAVFTDGSWILSKEIMNLILLNLNVEGYDHREIKYPE